MKLTKANANAGDAKIASIKYARNIFIFLVALNYPIILYVQQVLSISILKLAKLNNMAKTYWTYSKMTID